MVLKISHIYVYEQNESAWTNETLNLLYGPYLCVNSFQIKNTTSKIKLKKITLEKLSNFKWGENIEMNALGQLETLNGTVTLKIPYESMQRRLLPFIEFPMHEKTYNNEKDSSAFLKYLDSEVEFSENYEFKKKLTEKNLKLTALNLCKNQKIKQGFYDENSKAFFLLLGKDGFVHELNQFGFFLFGSICIDLNIGFFGTCETTLNTNWNKFYFEPWLNNKDTSKPIFPTLFLS